MNVNGTFFVPNSRNNKVGYGTINHWIQFFNQTKHLHSKFGLIKDEHKKWNETEGKIYIYILESVFFPYLKFTREISGCGAMKNEGSVWL